MVSKSPNPPEGFYLDPTAMALPNLGSLSTPTTTATTSDDPTKKIRKPYTISKSRESWTEPEHDKFLEALHLFDRDWKKIEAFVGSKTVIQIRSHAQKYFLKVQKSGANEHLPPPRPKRKATHPYPQKASKTAPVLSQVKASFQPQPALPDTGYVRNSDSTALHGNPVNCAATMSSRSDSMQTVGFSHGTKGDTRLAGKPVANNCSSSTESTPRTCPAGDMPEQVNHTPPLRVLPDFAQVYSFIGSVFDPNVSGHLQKLKKMDPIDVETVLLLMRNLSINLTSPDFEDYRHLLSSYEIGSENRDSGGVNITIQKNHVEKAAQFG